VPDALSSESRTDSKAGGGALWISLALLLTVALVYGQTAGFEFLLWDDDVYVTQNPIVSRGLTIEGVRWVFTSEHGSNWHPVTGLSHMLDCELFGLAPAAHHLVNVALHALNTLLLFGVLRSATGKLRPSALCAALFALHPLHVESVAWISERKDVLSASFGLAATWLWISWTRGGGGLRYASSLVLFALGLMAKPMLVTLPFVWLLLDAWPLGRLRGAVTRRVLELLPFFALAAAVSVATVAMQESADSIILAKELSFPLRLANSVVSLARYLGKTVWPVDLATFYPHPYLYGGQALSTLQIVGASLLLVVLTGLALGSRRGYIAVGWLWFLGMLVPVIGIVQVGAQAMADRYTYLPLVGVFIAVAFGLEELLGHARVGATRFTKGLLALVLVACAVRSWDQTRTWHDTIVLLEHSLSVAPRSALAHNNLGRAYAAEGQVENAAREFRASVSIFPLRVPYLNLGAAERALGNNEAAIYSLELALTSGLDTAFTHLELGLALEAVGRTKEAEEHLRRARELDPSIGP
jgi:hypothetical protein